jgi:predicted  nucleic acid-binding Zn-ribbon protein
VYLFHLWNTQASPSAVKLGAPGILGHGVVSAIKPPKRVCLEEPLEVTANLNLSDNVLAEVIEENQGKWEEVAPDLVLLSSTSSEDKTQEVRLEDILQSWDSLVRTTKALSSSFRSIQRKHSKLSKDFDERTSTLESLIGQCSENQLKDDYITIWDAISFLHSGLEALGKNLSDLQARNLSQENSLKDKVKALEESAQSTLTKISQSFSELATFTQVLSEEQALIIQQIKSSFDSDDKLAALRRDMQELNSKISNLDTTPNSSSSHMSEEVTALKIQVKLLESRIPIYNLLRLGAMTFQSQSEVAVFVENKVPHNSFSMFQDIVTLMERLSGTYVERKEVINEWYQAT